MKDLKPQKISGIGSIVEIDESLYSKHKYNIGRLLRRVWIVGGIELRTRDTFFVEVIKRDAETLENIILENVLPGTTIYTDCWKGCINLDKLGYNHLTVNHSHYFIDPETSTNTQLIENSWGYF
ncbi:hypothetical protein H311_01767 [Anncaliia algerae PRA109]|nr:hypothetical protein H311_01767 [Anncaliia algerae PRA109]